MGENNVNDVQRAERSATFCFSPRTEQRLNRRAKSRQIKWLLDKLQRAGRSTLGSNFNRNRCADHEPARIWVSRAKFFEKTRQADPRRIDIDDKKFGAKIGREFFGVGQGARDRTKMLGREFSKRRANGGRERVVFLQQKNTALHHTRRFGRTGHLGETSKFLGYDK